MSIRRIFKRWNAYRQAIREFDPGRGNVSDFGLGDIDRIGQHAPASLLLRLGR